MTKNIVLLAVGFAIMCIFGSFGGGNMFQANQAHAMLTYAFDVPAEYGIITGVVLAALVFSVIVGGMPSIASKASYLATQLCAFGDELSVVLHFFTKPWDTFTESLTDDDKTRLIASVSLCLNALGRTLEATLAYLKQWRITKSTSL